jgi:histidinol-phosphate aminotransferase
VRKLHPYVPGEQPKIKGLVKLNTNENPYPPSPKVLKAVRQAVDGRLRLYPNPTAQRLREKLAKLHRCKPENIIVGNGSDELLAMAVRTFVEPAAAGKAHSKSRVQFFTPSYSLYPVLAEIHGGQSNALPLGKDFALPPIEELKRGKRWDFGAALTFVTTPNAPSGRGYGRAELEPICKAQKGAVILDEAYVDFAGEHALDWARRYGHVLVARTFSKAYSLCFQRVGYLVGQEEVISAFDKIRDSYNVNGLGQEAALATLDDLKYYQRNFRRIIETRERLTSELRRLKFEVFPSQANFLLVRPPRYRAKEWLERFREGKILVRWFSSPAVCDYLRITIGTPEQADALIRAAERISG